MIKINKLTKTILILLGIISSIVLLFALYFFIVKHYYPELMNRGQFGDMFGALNALFSGLAFWGVIYAILIQREELKLQREELRLTREELKRTAKAQEESEKSLARQAESLKVTAKLNGLGAMLEYKGKLIEAQASGRSTVNSMSPDIKREADEIERQIKYIIDQKNV